MKYIDLTHRFSSNTPVSPYDKRPIFNQTKFKDKDFYNDTELTTTMHIGTHIDAPSHMTDIRKNMDQYPIDKFIGKPVLLNFKDKKQITLRDKDKDMIKKDSIVLIYTGEDKRIGTEDYYYNHPQVSVEFCDFLIEKGVKILALDFFSPDSSPSIIHKKLLSNDILIAENLTNLDRCLNEVLLEVSLVPLKIDTEGSFVRAYMKVK